MISFLNIEKTLDEERRAVYREHCWPALLAVVEAAERNCQQGGGDKELREAIGELDLEALSASVRGVLKVELIPEEDRRSRYCSVCESDYSGGRESDGRTTYSDVAITADSITTWLDLCWDHARDLYFKMGERLFDACKRERDS